MARESAVLSFEIDAPVESLSNPAKISTRYALFSKNKILES
jgi:hypothetical protein